MKCCFCGKYAGQWGNNPAPLTTRVDVVCCDSCNSMYVIPARLGVLSNEDTQKLIHIANTPNLTIKGD